MSNVGYWPIGQWVTFHAVPDTAYVNHFFPAWIHSMIQIPFQAKQVDLETLRCSAWSLRNLIHRRSLRSFLRTYKRSTCSKSLTHVKSQDEIHKQFINGLNAQLGFNQSSVDSFSVSFFLMGSWFPAPRYRYKRLPLFCTHFTIS